LGLAPAPDIDGHHAILAPKAVAADRAEEMRPMPTPAVPTRQEDGFVGIEEAPVAVMPRLALGKCGGLEIPLDRAPTEFKVVRPRVQGPALPMRRPDLLVAGHPLGTPTGGEGRRPCGRRRRRERHGRDTRGCGWAGRIVHGRWGREALGIDARQLGGVGSEHVGQHVREIVQQVKPVRHLAGRGRPGAGRFRVRLRPIPHEYFATPGCACSHWATVAASRSGRRARGRRRARSHTSVP
jgi:hypothetical protein